MSDKTIVVLGAGPSALPVVRQTMVNFVLKKQGFKMVVVSPNTHFHWPVAMPRAIVPGQFEDDKVLIPIEPTFSSYPADKFEWIQGSASSLDTTSKTVQVELNGGAGVKEVVYNTLVIATGSRTIDDMPWKSLSTQDAKDSLHKVRDQIKKAKTIVVVGGGLTGVETAGELGFEYSQHGTKRVVLVHNSNLPLAPPAVDKVRQSAADELKRLKVEIIANTTVSGTTTNEKGETIVELKAADGTTSTITTQAYIAATGVVPNTSFVPSNLLDDKKFVKQTNKLQVEGHSDIFVIGDAGNLEISTLKSADAQAGHMVKSLPIYLAGGDAVEYSPSTMIALGATIGRSRGTGQLGTWKMFSIMIWLAKGRYMGTDKAEAWAAGKRIMMQVFEK